MKSNLILYGCGGFLLGAALSTPNGLDCMKFLVIGVIVLIYAFKNN